METRLLLAGFQDLNSWTPYDAGDNGEGTDPDGYQGGVFDGRYIYFAPNFNGDTGFHGEALRYDTTGDFETVSSWEAFDPGVFMQIPEEDRDGYVGGAFDGRYVYFVPQHNGTNAHGLVLRFDTTGAFDGESSWTAYDPSVMGEDNGYAGAVFDGQHVYFVPHNNGTSYHGAVLRYNTHAAFDADSSWEAFDPGVHGKGLHPDGYLGGVFDGSRYVYFAPDLYAASSYHSEVIRLDTTGGFGDPASWTVFDPATDVTVQPQPRGGYSGAVFDGRFVYFVPQQDGPSGHHAQVLRYDTTGGFESGLSWDTFDPGANGLGSDVKGYYGATFDGRYIYFSPFHNSANFHGNVLRYDTQGSFAALSSWKDFDSNDRGGYSGAVFDGEFVYFVPLRDDAGYHGEVLRYGPINRAPVLPPPTDPVIVDEGGVAANTGSFDDPDDGDAVQVTASIGTVTQMGMESGTWSWSLPTNDGPADSTLVTITATDDEGNVSSVDFQVVVNNVPPTIGSVLVPLIPIDINDQASHSVDALFSDPAGVLDEPYTCDFDMNNDLTNDVMVTGVVGTSCNTTLNYSEPGVYSVAMTVTDKDNGISDTVIATDFIVIYDPAGGFVTGGGWIDSAEGALVTDPSANGKANFGFVSKYKKGRSVPSGNTEFNFNAGDLNFNSDTYDWLVINQNDTNAQYKGSGTINGDPALTGDLFKFMIWAKDLDPGGDDTFRIKIWYDDGGEVLVYDNGFDQPIGGGNIKIHGSQNSTVTETATTSIAESRASSPTSLLLDQVIAYWILQDVSQESPAKQSDMRSGGATDPIPESEVAQSLTDAIWLGLATSQFHANGTGVGGKLPHHVVDVVVTQLDELGELSGIEEDLSSELNTD